MLDTVAAELRELGIDARVEPAWSAFGNGAVLFAFNPASGRLKDRQLRIALTFQEDAYPEYPPHFVHVCGLTSSKLTRHAEHEFSGEQWWAFSVPPSDFWDSLDPGEKNMRTYVWRHLTRVWDQL